MIKYLSKVSESLKSIKKGMETDSVLWNNISENPGKVQSFIDRIEAVEKEIERLENLIDQKKAEARALSKEGREYAARLESIAAGIAGNEPAKFVIYGITQRKVATKRPRPIMHLYITIKDAADGSGFILTTKKDPDAIRYEWQKGAGADPTVTERTPELVYFASSTRMVCTDKEVQKGVRYFYRVRAVNNSGYGPWSEAYSKVQ